MCIMFLYVCVYTAEEFVVVLSSLAIRQTVHRHQNSPLVIMDTPNAALCESMTHMLVPVRWSTGL